MSALPGDRIVCFHDTGICDGKHEHDVRLWTDGLVAYATASIGEECTVSRDLTQIEVACAAVVGEARNGDPIRCTGHARFDLTDECWTTDAQTVGMLNSYGQRIES